MNEQQSKLQGIKVELDNLNGRLYNLANEIYKQTSNLCGEFNRGIDKLPEAGDFYVDIFEAQIVFQNQIINDIENTVRHLISATDK